LPTGISGYIAHAMTTHVFTTGYRQYQREPAFGQRDKAPSRRGSIFKF
jgi:hypothetical protein